MVISAEISIRSTREKVWAAFTDLTCWEDWNTVLRGVRSKVEILTKGAALKCTLRPFFFPVGVELMIEEVVPYERVVWATRKKGLKARHEFIFTEDGGRVHVVSRETFSGPLAAASGILLPVRRMEGLTKVFLSDLRKSVEQ